MRLPRPNLAALIARAKWIKTARSAQLTPKGKWNIWLILAGRGWGKTRTGAEDIAAYVLWRPCVRVGVIAPTFADARDVCIEGESGLLHILPPSCVKAWHRSTGDLSLYNGSRIKLYSADQPERLRGPQHHRVWCDELGAWPSRGAFDQMWFGLRLGNDPRVVITTTPRNTQLVREIVARAGADVYLTRGRTVDNKAHLATCVLDQLKARYAGTRLGRQELDAELLEDTEGSLWTRELIDASRVRTAPEMCRIVVAVDPALSYNENSDETGIVAAGLASDGLIYVLDDWSCKASPEIWARRAVQLYEEREACMIVAEVNAGGALVERLLRQVDKNIFFKPLRAIRGKIERAMPVAALYEQGRVRHVGAMVKLEDQMSCFSPLYIGGKSPDRVDALVWAITELSDTIRSEPR
ncbi:MAG TPA: ATP-binding protein, partial [Rhodospirillaceae bacterium]|nr:ATP-binding protein [Rhodospirillaceae bacterium]